MNPNAGAISGLVGGIVGGVIGIMGGVIGTYFSIRNTTRPRERTVAIRMATTIWIFVVGLLLLDGALMYRLPPGWGGLMRWSASRSRWDALLWPSFGTAGSPRLGQRIRGAQVWLRGEDM